MRIIDENDNAPEFPEEEYVTELREGPNTVGATIATVTAIDPDEGLNGTIRYAISKGNLAQTFQISDVTVRGSMMKLSQRFWANIEFLIYFSIKIKMYVNNLVLSNNP